MTATATAADPRILPLVDPVRSILEAFAAEPDRVVVRDEDGPVSAADASAVIHRTVQALESAGAGPGDVVPCIADGCAASLLMRISLAVMGATFFDLPITMAVADLAGYIERARAGVAIVETADSEGAARIGALRALLPAVRFIPLSELCDAPARRETTSPAIEAMSDALSALAPAELRCELREVDRTSGTTGPPKMALLRSSLRVGPRARVTALQADAATRFLACGRLSFYMARVLGHGGTVRTFRHFDAGVILRAIADEGITHLLICPEHLRALVEHPDRHRVDTSSLQWLTCMGAPASAQLLGEAVAAFGPIVRVTYGQTEAALITALLPDDYWPGSLQHLGTCGPPRGGIEIAIGEPDSPLPSGSRGPIWVHTRTAMIGYVDQPELTEQVLRDGWVRTGDAGVQDADGYLTVLGRLDDAIELNGRTVFPREIEECLELHPDVYRAAALTMPSADGGRSELHVAVVRRGGAQADIAVLGDWLAPQFGADCVPHRIHFIDRIPLNHGYSTDYAALQRQFADES
jgi:fatty-acyl-CoA synthase